MDINEMLKGVDCSCARHYVRDIKFVSIWSVPSFLLAKASPE